MSKLYKVRDQSHLFLRDVLLSSQKSLLQASASKGVHNILDRLWNTEGLNNGVSHGVFNDTGNFVFEDGDFNGLWETFKFTSDTLLPSQVVKKGGKLYSRLNETYFSKGRFDLLLQSDGNLVMHSINLPSGYVNENYYESQTVGSNTSSAGTQSVLDRSGYLYVLGENNEKYNVSKEKRKFLAKIFILAQILILMECSRFSSIQGI